MCSSARDVDDIIMIPDVYKSMWVMYDVLFCIIPVRRF